MKSKIIVLLMLFVVSSFGADIDFTLPDEIHEFENQILVVKSKSEFTIQISNKCLKISNMNNIQQKGKNFYSTGNNSYIELENKCFENDEVKIEIKSKTGKIIKDYKILKAIEEERDWGC